MADYVRYEPNDVNDRDKFCPNWKYLELYLHMNPGHPQGRMVDLERAAYKHELYDTKKELLKVQNEQKQLYEGNLKNLEMIKELQKESEKKTQENDALCKLLIESQKSTVCFTCKKQKGHNYFTRSKIN